MSEGINVLCLVKGSERYIFMYSDDQRNEAMQTLGRFAENPELTFSWWDASVLAQRIRAIAAAEEVSE